VPFCTFFSVNYEELMTLHPPAGDCYAAHHFNAVWEFIYNAFPFFYPPEQVGKGKNFI